MKPQELTSILRRGEGQALEFKRSTGELKEAMQSLCAFLNGSGGMVLLGIRPDGTVEGQAVSDQTLRDIAHAAERFEPPAHTSIQRLQVKAGREVIALEVENTPDIRPFTWAGHAYERVGSTTRQMPQSKYERLLLERGHAKRRWENLPAEGLTLKDLDRREILRTRDLAIQQNRISPDTSRDIGDILDRLGLRLDGVLTRAAQILFGTDLLAHYPQCLLKLGRFRGTGITGEIVDNRQERMNAFTMVREGMAFLERTMPLGARFPEGKIFREDHFQVPPDALREILLNAIIHRDYSYSGGHVAIVVFDDRIEIRSYGRLPDGVSLKQLSGPHLSELRNPLIAEAFHRTGAVECWGRGTNRVIELCHRHGAAQPTFEERQGFLIVTFKVAVAEPAVEAPPPQVAPQVAPQVTPQVRRILKAGAAGPKTREELQRKAGINDREHFRKAFLEALLSAGWLKKTIPDKPRSRFQKYRTTESGVQALM